MSGLEALDKPLATLAFCWRLERRDGVTIGLTSHDRDLEIGHVRYRAAPGVMPSAIRSGITAEGSDTDLQAPVAPSTSPDCRARLGDRQCRVDLAARRKIVAVEGVEDVEVGVSGLVTGAYAFGMLRWMTGPNAGAVQGVVDNGASGLTLADPPAFAVEAGTLALLTEGCDRQLETCRMRFANVLNFRGEPYLPGTDLLTRYPGA